MAGTEGCLLYTSLEVEVGDLLGGHIVDVAVQDGVDDAAGILDGDALAGAGQTEEDSGVLAVQGGCYAKVINLDKDYEPDIYNAKMCIRDSNSGTMDWMKIWVLAGSMPQAR